MTVAGLDTTSDVLCAGCEYNLRGLPRESRCPECGAEVESSWKRYEAQLASGRGPLALCAPRWLRRLALGCSLLVVAGAGVIASMAIWVLRAPSDTQWLALSLGLQLMMTAGMWMLTAREPAAPSLWADRATRRTARAAIGLSLAVALWYFIMQSGLHFFGDLGALQRQSVLGVILDAMITWLIWRHLARLVRRTAHARLATCANAFAWLLPPTMILQVAFFFTLPAHGQMWFGSPAPVAGALLAVALLPFSLLDEPRLDATVILWSLAAALSLGAMVLLARLSVLFAATARRGENRNGGSA